MQYQLPSPISPPFAIISTLLQIIPEKYCRTQNEYLTDDNATTLTTTLSQRSHWWQRYPNNDGGTSPLLPHQRQRYPNDKYATPPTTTLPHRQRRHLTNANPLTTLLSQRWRRYPTNNKATAPQRWRYPNDNDVAIRTRKTLPHRQQRYRTNDDDAIPTTTTLLSQQQRRYRINDNTNAPHRNWMLYMQV